jgi:hypothetical protein
LPNGSTTDAVTKPAPRGVIGPVRRRAEGDQPVDGALQVVDVPVHDRPTDPVGGGRRLPAAIDDAQLVGVVADPELDVGRAPSGPEREK